MSRHPGKALAVPLGAAAALLVGLGTAAPADAGPETAVLRADEQLAAGQRLVTANGISLVMEPDGRLVEYAPGDSARWWITTNRPGTVLRMQPDGNLALVVPGGYVIWSTRTGGNPGASLQLAQDGAATVRSTSGAQLWTNGVRISVPTAPTTAPSAPPTTTAPSATTAPPSAPTTTAPATGTPSSGPAAEVAALTSTERTRNGCPALQVDPRLTTAAQGHAADMAANSYFSHTSLDGRTFDQRIRAAGHPSPGGENIAKGQTSPSAVVTAWMNSPGHRANILNCSFRTIGVGFDARGNHWVQNFGY
jgi:uncharacterized protein YkwD